MAPLGEVAMEVYEMLEGSGRKGLETGFYELDDMLNGLQPGEMIIVAARPSMGKTAFAMNLIEAMAFGLPILTTRWRSLPELFPANYAGLVDVRAPEQIANVMPALMTGEAGDGFREIFLRNFTLERHLAGLADAFTQLEQPQPAALPAAALGTLPR